MRKTEAKIRVFSTLMRMVFVLYPGHLFIHQEPEFQSPLIAGAT